MSDIFELFRKIRKDADKPTIPVTHIIAGLGNPGDKYARSRHNAGFLALDYLSQKRDVRIDRLRFKSLTGEVTIGSFRVLLMKPQTFMNNSGEAVGEAARFYKIPPENIVVISDDVTLDAGRMRIRKNGSDGGHNGLKSIIYHLSSDAFTRIRLGVGKKPDEYDLADFVLGIMPEADRLAFFKVLGDVPGALEMILEKKTEDAMSRYNGVRYGECDNGAK